MNNFGKGFSALGRMSLSQDIPPRFGQCNGLIDVVLLLVFALTLSSCENTTREPDIGTAQVDTSMNAPTPMLPNGEVFKGVTANGRVIFEREVGGQTDLFGRMADGSAPEVPLATTPAADESFGGVF